MVRGNALALAAAAMLTACSSDPKPDPVTPIATTPPPAATPKKDTATPSSGSVHIDDKIVKACGDLPTAHFAFDSTSIDADAARALDALARCFSAGPLKGRSVALIGHADPRGEFDYNMGLGQRRAGSVGDYLTTHGVEKGHVAASSRGEIEAVGADDEGWARDRKVDVLLAK